MSDDLPPVMADELRRLGVFRPPPAPESSPPEPVAWKPSYPGEEPPF